VCLAFLRLIDDCTFQHYANVISFPEEHKYINASLTETYFLEKKPHNYNDFQKLHGIYIIQDIISLYLTDFIVQPIIHSSSFRNPSVITFASS